MINADPCCPDEKFRPIEGYRAYDVSSCGRVRSRLGLSARILKDHWNSNKLQDYRIVYLSGKRSKVHQLVMAAFPSISDDGEYLWPHPFSQTPPGVLGQTPGGSSARILIRHLDGRPENNHRSNLAYGTDWHNAQDRVRHGRQQRGESTWNSKLTTEQVLAIREDPRSLREIAEDYGIDFGNVGRIKRRETWSHV